MPVKIDGNGQITGATNTVPTGAFTAFMLPAAPTGWIAGIGQTMGKAGSGATIADDTVKALFFAWWAYTDAQLPILTSAGGASTRGASAQADWDALRRLTVFDVRDRVPRIAGTTFVNGTKYATTTQDHNHRMSMGSDGASFYSWLTGGDVPVFGTEVVSGARALLATGSPVASTSIRLAYTEGVRTASLTSESAPNTIAMLGCFKL